MFDYSELFPNRWRNERQNRVDKQFPVLHQTPQNGAYTVHNMHVIKIKPYIHVASYVSFVRKPSGLSTQIINPNS